LTRYANRWDGRAFVPAPSARRVIPRLKLLQRFTRPSARPSASAVASPELADRIEQAHLARETDVDAPTTAAELNPLVAGRLLTAERMPAVLA
jgi:hypothetical protein